jgi:hypothetical protein
MNLIVGALARLMQEAEPEASQRRDVGYMHLMCLLDKARLVRLEAFKLVDTQRSTALADTLRGLDDTTDRSASLALPARLSASSSSLAAPTIYPHCMHPTPKEPSCSSARRGRYAQRGQEGREEHGGRGARLRQSSSQPPAHSHVAPTRCTGKARQLKMGEGRGVNGGGKAIKAPFSSSVPRPRLP